MMQMWAGCRMVWRRRESNINDFKTISYFNVDLVQLSLDERVSAAGGYHSCHNDHSHNYVASG